MNTAQSPEFRNEEKFHKPYCVYLEPKFSLLHYHRHIEFIFVTENELKLEIEGKEKILHVGDCAFIFPYVLHSYKVEGHPKRFCATLEPEQLGELGEIMLKFRPKTAFISARAVKKAIPDIQRLMDTLVMNYCRSEDPVLYARQLSYITHIFSSLIDVTGLEKVSNKHSIISDAVKLCCDNFMHESFDSDVLADKLNISVSRLRQVFDENMGMSFKKYISSLRINHAQSLLCNTSLSVADIASSCGYGSIRTFNREFSAVCDMTPTKFREEWNN